MSFERSLGDAERDACDPERGERGHRDVDDRFIDARLVGHRHERPLAWHDDAVNTEMVAARPAQTGHVPRVLDRDLVGTEHRHAKLGRAVDDRFDAVAEQPVGVLAAAGEAPSAGHPVPVADGGDRAGRVEDAGHDRVSARGEQAVERGAGEPGEVAPRAASDHHGPADGRVGSGEGSRRPASRSAGRHRCRRGCSAATPGSSRPRSARRADRCGTRRAASISAARAVIVGASSSRRLEDALRRRRRPIHDRHAFTPSDHGRSIGASAAWRARSSSSQPPLQ